MQVVRHLLAGMEPCTPPSPTVCNDLLHQNELELGVLKSGSRGFNFPNAEVSGRKTPLLCVSARYHGNNLVFRKATQLASSVKKPRCNWLNLQNV
jgi:hypothetical protein